MPDVLLRQQTRWFRIDGRRRAGLPGLHRNRLSLSLSLSGSPTFPWREREREDRGVGRRLISSSPLPRPRLPPRPPSPLSLPTRTRYPYINTRGRVLRLPSWLLPPPRSWLVPDRAEFDPASGACSPRSPRSGDRRAGDLTFQPSLQAGVAAETSILFCL